MGDNHDKSTDASSDAAPNGGGGSDASRQQGLPRYEKPVLRRYDQIEQVRPYGPSEI